MNKTVLSIALLGSAALAASALRAADPVATLPPTPLMTPEPAISPTPGPNAHGMAEKEYNAVVKAALQPLKDKLLADRQALKDAKASGDADKIAAAKAAIKEDLTAIRLKRTEMEHARRSLAKPVTPGTEDRGGGKPKADEMKAKGQEHRK